MNQWYIIIIIYSLCSLMFLDIYMNDTDLYLPIAEQFPKEIRYITFSMLLFFVMGDIYAIGSLIIEKKIEKLGI